jgi:hypothetical protein
MTMDDVKYLTFLGSEEVFFTLIPVYELERLDEEEPFFTLIYSKPKEK